MKDVQAVVYDLDSTLLDTMMMSLKAYMHCLNTFGVEVDLEEVKETCLNRTDDIVARHYDIDLGVFSERYRDYVIAAYPEQDLFPGVLETLAELREQDFKLGIATLKDRAKVASVLARGGFEDYFDYIGLNEGTGHGETKDSILERVITEFDLEPSEVMFVGDSADDIEAAHEVVAIPVLFFPPEHREFYNKYELLALQPECVIQSHTELLSML